MHLIGFAVWQSQELETMAASYLVVRIKAVRGIGKEEGEALVSSAEKQTFGSLLRELEKAGVVPSQLSARLQTAVDERNWLVHRSRRESRGILENPSAYSALVARVESMSEAALKLLKELGSELHKYVIASGVSSAQIDAEAERIARSWGLIS